VRKGMVFSSNMKTRKENDYEKLLEDKVKEEEKRNETK